MLKQMLLIGAAAVSFPALAQTTPPASDPMSQPTTTEPVSPAPAPAPDTTSPTPDTTNPAPMPDSSTPPAAFASSGRAVRPSAPSSGPGRGS